MKEGVWGPSPNPSYIESHFPLPIYISMIPLQSLYDQVCDFDAFLMQKRESISKIRYNFYRVYKGIIKISPLAIF